MAAGAGLKSSPCKALCVATTWDHIVISAVISTWGHISVSGITFWSLTYVQSIATSWNRGEMAIFATGSLEGSRPGAQLQVGSPSKNPTQYPSSNPPHTKIAVNLVNITSTIERRHFLIERIPRLFSHGAERQHGEGQEPKKRSTLSPP